MAGWVRRAVSSDSTRVWTHTDTHLRVLRSGVPVTVEQYAWWEENVGGDPVSLRLTNRYSGVDITTEVTVTDTVLVIDSAGGGGSARRTVSRPVDLLFPQGVAALHASSNRVPGDRFTYSVFDLDLEDVDRLTADVQGVETRRLLGSDRRLTRVEVTSERYAGLVVRQWRDEAGLVWREEIPSLEIVRERVSAPPSGGDVVELDLLAVSRIECGIALADRWGIGRAVYELWVADGEAAIVVPEDARQRLIGTTERGVLLEVKRVVPGTPAGSSSPGPESAAAPEVKGAPPGDSDEYLSSGPIIRWDAPEIIEAARSAAGDAGDDWDKARAVARWVGDAVTDKGFGTAFATATEVLATGRGDCTEHAVLAVAMARALGIPARAVSGIVHHDGAFLHHMWLEVWARGGWYALDPTEDPDSVDATHIKLGTSALAGGGAAELNVAVSAALNRLRVVVVETERDESGGESW